MECAKLCILIVEDIKIAQTMAMMTMLSLGCIVDVANNGADALSLCTRRQYDLILMDLGLPDMDGLTIVETIRNEFENKNRKTPIIALTAHVSEEFKRITKSAGMDGFLSKPLTLEKAESLLAYYENKTIIQSGVL